MAAIEVSLLWASRGATDTDRNRRTYTRQYEVVTDNPNDDEQVVGNANVGGTKVPLPGDPLDTDAQAVVVDMDFNQSDESPTLWYVTAKYDSEPELPEAVDIDGNPASPGSLPDNPLLVPATWKLTTQDSEEVAVSGLRVKESGAIIIPDPPAWAISTAYTKGKYVKNGGNVYLCVQSGTSAGAGGPSGVGTEIVDNTCLWNYHSTYAQSQNDFNFFIRGKIANSAGLPFDPPLMVEVSRAVLQVTKNMPVATLEYLVTLKNAVNSIPWRGRAARTAKVLKIEHDGGKQQNGIKYVTTQWEIGLDPDTWDLRALDAGTGTFRTVNNPNPPGGTSKQFIRFRDIYGDEFDILPLNGGGNVLGPDDDPVFLRFLPLQQRLIDFNQALPF